MLKKMSILLVAVLLMVMVATPVFANNAAAGTTEIETKVNDAMTIAINVAQSIGIAVAVILLIVVAIKYMAAAPSDKAEIKKHMVVYVVGAILLMCAAGVLQIIKTLGNSVVNENTNTVTKPDIHVQF